MEPAVDLLNARPAFLSALCEHVASADARTARSASALLAMLVSARPALVESVLATPVVMKAALKRMASTGDIQSELMAVRLVWTLTGNSTYAAESAGGDGSGGVDRSEALWRLCGEEGVRQLAAAVVNHPPESVCAQMAMQVLSRVTQPSSFEDRAVASLSDEAAKRPALLAASARLLVRGATKGGVKLPEFVSGTCNMAWGACSRLHGIGLHANGTGCSRHGMAQRGMAWHGMDCTLWGLCCSGWGTRHGYRSVGCTAWGFHIWLPGKMLACAYCTTCMGVAHPSAYNEFWACMAHALYLTHTPCAPHAPPHARPMHAPCTIPCTHHAHLMHHPMHTLCTTPCTPHAPPHAPPYGHAMHAPCLTPCTTQSTIPCTIP